MVGAKILAGTAPSDIVKQTEYLLSMKKEWANPFGNGTVGQQIVDILVNQFSTLESGGLI